jgi:hypothetical protein
MVKPDRIFNLLLLAAVFAAASGWRPAAAQEAEQPDSGKAVSFGTEVDLNRSYIWRGIRYNQGFLVQPAAWISSYGFTFTGWANIVAQDGDTLAETGTNEVDLILEYGAAAGSLELTPSFTYYHYPRDRSFNSGELAVKASLPIGPVSLSTDHIIDVVKYKGAYFGDLGIEYEKEFNSKLSFGSYLYIRWASDKFNQNYTGLEEGSLNYADLGLSLPYYLTENLYLTPHLELNIFLNKELGDYLDKNPVNFGLIAGCEF